MADSNQTKLDQALDLISRRGLSRRIQDKLPLLLQHYINGISPYKAARQCGIGLKAAERVQRRYNHIEDQLKA